MSDNSKAEPVQTPEQDDQNKNIQPKYTVKLFGRFVPIWLVVVIVAILAWIGWNMWTKHIKQNTELGSTDRAILDKAVNTTTTSPTPNVNSSASGIPLSSPNTEETRRQLNKLFNSF